MRWQASIGREWSPAGQDLSRRSTPGGCRRRWCTADWPPARSSRQRTNGAGVRSAGAHAPSLVGADGASPPDAGVRGGAGGGLAATGEVDGRGLMAVLLVLRTLAVEPMHGWGLAQRIETMSGDVFAIQQGTLYPALQRLKRKGWVQSEWRITENNRRARYYFLTDVGRQQLATELRGLGSDRGRRERRAELGWRDEMRLLTGLFRRCRSLFRRKREDAETLEELRFHLEMEAEKNLRAGMDPREARRQAHVRLGGVEAIRAAGRGGRPLEDLVRDFGYTFRSLRRNRPAGTACRDHRAGGGPGLGIVVVRWVTSLTCETTARRLKAAVSGPTEAKP